MEIVQPNRPDEKKLLENLFKLPNPQAFIEETQKKLEEERKNREYFYNEVAEFKKSEFIL